MSYVSFLDGVYFNALAKSGKTGKADAQMKQIHQALRANRYNYFVNTAGFMERLRESGAQI